MSYDLTPRNKKAGDYRIGAFTWPQMLKEGLGLVLGTGDGFRPAEFIYLERPDGLCVHYNDGAHVTAKECKDLVKVSRWIADIQTLTDAGGRDLDSAVYIRSASGADPAAVRASLDQELAAFPAVKLQDQASLKDQINQQFDRVFGFIYALLALAVIVA